MRGRHTSAILQMLDITETIASSIAQYVEIAVRLGWAPKIRQGIAAQMWQGHARLYGDKTAVAAVEDFYWRAVEEVRSRDTGVALTEQAFA